MLIGLDWIGLDWIGLDWIGLDWIGLDWIGLDWIDIWSLRSFVLMWYLIVRMNHNSILFHVQTLLFLFFVFCFLFLFFVFAFVFVFCFCFLFFALFIASYVFAPFSSSRILGSWGIASLLLYFFLNFSIPHPPTAMPKRKAQSKSSHSIATNNTTTTITSYQSPASIRQRVFPSPTNMC